MLRRALWLPALAGLALAGHTFSLDFSHSATLPLTLLCMFLYVASLGFIAPNSSASALATHGQRAGTASALMGALQFGLATLTGIGISQLHDGSARPLAILLALCGVGAWLLHRWLVHPHDRHHG
jgi:DHA1 family bicyclomycin/chloramphenicol resistance-like MFS transporter